MIVLRSSDILVLLDENHGGEMVSLVDLGSGRQLLGTPPFAALAPLGGDLDEVTWTDRYRGGWQTVTPNAGNACIVDGDRHGFHGRASNDPWEVSAATDQAATLTWVGHGLAITRTIELDGDGVAVATTWTALEDEVAFVSVEHIAFGIELLAPSATIRFPGGTVYEISETGGPIAPPSNAPTWPDALLLDGTHERADAVSLAEPSSRLLCVADVPEGRYEVVNDETGQGVRVTWDVAALPHLWLWREVRATGGHWRSQAEILGLEPASVPHSLGLGRARAEGQAAVLRRSERHSSWVRLMPFQA